MIVELIVGVGLVAAGAAAARILVRRREAVERALDDESRAASEATTRKAGAKRADTRKRGKKKAEEKRTGPRGLRVGDVLLYADTEFWLAGCIELDEEGLVARLFPCPGAKRAEWVAQLDKEASDLATLSETDEVPGGPIPEALPIDGRRLSLERRGTAEVVATGEHLPRTTDRARYTLLSDAGGRVLVVVDFVEGSRLALSGERVSRHMIDLLPGGDLDDETAPRSK